MVVWHQWPSNYLFEWLNLMTKVIRWLCNDRGMQHWWSNNNGLMVEVRQPWFNSRYLWCWFDWNGEVLVIDPRWSSCGHVTIVWWWQLHNSPMDFDDVNHEIKNNNVLLCTSLALFKLSFNSTYVKKKKSISKIL